MQASLVSYYGPKLAKLASYLNNLQEELAASLSEAFTPYTSEQVHASMIGLECWQSQHALVNVNFKVLKQQTRRVDTDSLLSYLRSPSIPCFDVQVGGYSFSEDYGFLSQGQHPHLRSFTIRNDIAVAMGWPADKSHVIDKFRRSFNDYNIWHKWHKTDFDFDNDFYFVLGKVKRDAVDETRITGLENRIRKRMAHSPPLILNVDSSTMSIVCYKDPELPTQSSIAHAINDLSFTADDLAGCFTEQGNENS